MINYALRIINLHYYRCRQIPWQRDDNLISAWKNARTGYPFIDAIMTQLRVEGWIHHLTRHAVACFLTRGDLWQHWEEGAKIFDLYLLDADWALNNGNWQWLSCSNFFYQYFRCYSPVAFGKKTDKNGDYIRKWLPQLSRFPQQYIYEPWTAPLSLQKSCGCVIGEDYPARIVIHETVSKENMNKMKIAYGAEGQKEDVETDGSRDLESVATGKNDLELKKRTNVAIRRKEGHASLEKSSSNPPPTVAKKSDKTIKSGNDTCSGGRKRKLDNSEF